VSNHALITVSDGLRHRRAVVGTRWRRLTADQQALLVMAHLRKGETYADLAAGFAIGTTTVFRYIRESPRCPGRARTDAARRGDRRRAEGIRDHRRDIAAHRPGRYDLWSRPPYYSGKHKCHGVNVQVIADPAGRLIWASPALPGARHDMGAAREHGILDALHRRRHTRDSRQRLPRLRV
jgi:hypothetical protein